MKRAAPLLLMMMTAASTPSTHAQTPPQAPAFLAGCWEQRSGELLIQEHWMAPAGGQTLGMARTLKQSRMLQHEHMLIETTPAGGLDFVALPSGQALTRFALVKQGPQMVEFSNPAHDFPNTVRYTLLGPDELLAQIEGVSKGQPKTITFRYRRVACPS